MASSIIYNSHQHHNLRTLLPLLTSWSINVDDVNWTVE